MYEDLGGVLMAALLLIIQTYPVTSSYRVGGGEGVSSLPRGGGCNLYNSLL